MNINMSDNDVKVLRGILLRTARYRYVVLETGSPKRPYEVWDSEGGWCCSGFGSLGSAQKRANEQNAKQPDGGFRGDGSAD